MITRMMGDVSLTTVMEHYFDSSLEHMQGIVERWDQLERRPPLRCLTKAEPDQLRCSSSQRLVLGSVYRAFEKLLEIRFQDKRVG